MPAPDMVFTPDEVDAYRTRAASAPGPTATTAAPPATSTEYTVEEIDRHRPGRLDPSSPAPAHERAHAESRGAPAPAPDMVFTPAEVAADDRAHGIPTPAPTDGGPDMVITPSEVAAYDRAHPAAHPGGHHQRPHHAHGRDLPQDGPIMVPGPAGPLAGGPIGPHNASGFEGGKLSRQPLDATAHRAAPGASSLLW